MKARLKISTQFKDTLLLSYDQLEGKLIVLKKLSFFTRILTRYRLFIHYRRMGAKNTLLRYAFQQECVFVLPIHDDAVCGHIKKVYEKDNLSLSLYLMEDVIFQSLDTPERNADDWHIILLCAMDHTYSLSAFYKGFLIFKRSLDFDEESSVSIPPQPMYEELISSCRYLKRIASFPQKIPLLLLNFLGEGKAQHITKELFYQVMHHLKNHGEATDNNGFKLDFEPRYMQGDEKTYLTRGLKSIQSRSLLLPFGLWPVILSKNSKRFFRSITLPLCLITGLLWSGLQGFHYVYSIDTLTEQLILQQKRPTDFHLLEGLYHHQQQPFFDDFLKKIARVVAGKNTPLMVERTVSKSMDNHSRTQEKNAPLFHLAFQEKIPMDVLKTIKDAFPNYRTSHHTVQKNRTMPLGHPTHAPLQIETVVKMALK